MKYLILAGLMYLCYWVLFRELRDDTKRQNTLALYRAAEREAKDRWLRS